MPNAHVVATRVNTNEQTAVESGGDGSYVFPSLAPAEYSISVTAAGFSNYVQRNILLEANQALTVNVSLQVGGTTQTVDVSAAPPQVDTTTGTLSRVIGRQSVNDFPLNGRLGRLSPPPIPPQNQPASIRSQPAQLPTSSPM